ncbi:hypothetical protein C8R43DRAFT_1119109 [Mycena crocata]|nr:hypothetical protein C8R43DRAFT_1119109 [Mycena crocata]
MSDIDLGPTYGALLIGVLVTVFFRGILTVQAYIYYESFPQDSWKLKTLVALVCGLDLGHVLLICQTVYHFLVDNWGDYASLGYTSLPLMLHIVFVGSTAIICQCFFLYRVWTFSGRSLLLTAFLSLPCLVTFGLHLFLFIWFVAGDRSIGAFDNVKGEVVAMLALGAGADVTIALLLVWYLQQASVPMRRTTFVAARVIQYTVVTSVSTSLVALASVIANIIKPNSFIPLAVHLSLGRLYTNSLLATLNSRRNLRAMLAEPAVLSELSQAEIAFGTTMSTRAGTTSDIEGGSEKTVHGVDASFSTEP